MKKTNLRKILTLIFTLTFIGSTILGTLPAFSLDGNTFTSYSDENTETDTSLGDKNILLGIIPQNVVYKTPTEETPISANVDSKLTDGVFTEEWSKSSALFTDGTNVIGNGIAIGDYSVEISFKLDKIYEITGFEMFSKTGNLSICKYQIYASVNENDLFDSKNILVDFDNSATKKVHNAFKLASGKTAPKAMYYGVRILDPACSKNNRAWLYPRLRELTLYGKEPPALEDPFVCDEVAELPTKYGSNLAPDAVFEVKFKPLNGEYKNAGGAIGNLNDGDLGNEYAMSNNLFADTTNNKWIGNGIAEGEIYQDIMVDLKYIANITGITVINHHNNGLATHKYSIYFSNNKGDLFTNPSFYDVVNPKGYQRNTLNISLLNKSAPKSARYLGIRIIDPTASKPTSISINYLCSKIKEIAIFGELTSEGGDPVQPVRCDDNAVIPTEFEGENIAIQSKTESKFFDPKTDNYGKAEASSGAEIINLTDGDPNTQFRTAKNKFGIEDKDNPANNKWLGNGLSEGDVYQDVTIDLNYISKINALSLVTAATNGIAIKKYAIYFGNDKGKLYEGTPFYTMENNSGAQRNIFDVKNINGNQPISARFVGIRVLDATAHKPPAITFNNCYLRLQEISIFGALTDEGGDIVDPNVVYDDVIELPSWGNNIALDKKPFTYAKNKNGYVATSAKNVMNLSDGDLTNQFEEQSIFFEVSKSGVLEADHSSSGKGDWYTDIIFDFKSEIFFEGFAVIHHKNFSLMTREYAIYVGDTKAELFDEGNCVHSTKNTEVYRRYGINFKGKGLDYKGRYVGVRILAPTQDPKTATGVYGVGTNNKIFNYSYTRIHEFAVYGNYTDPDYEYVPKFNPMKDAPPDSYFKGNLLLGKLADGIYYNSKRWNNDRTKDRVGAITNGLTITPYGTEEGPDGTTRELTHCDFNGLTFNQFDGSQYVDFYWDLKKIYDFSKFAMLSQIGEGKSYYTGWYRVYVSDDYDLLFEDSSIAFEYNALDEDEPDELCKGQEVKFSKSVTGRYVAIRILNPVYNATNWVRPRIVEVGIWGKEAPLDVSPTNLSANMPVNAYLGEYGNLQEVKNFSLKDSQNLSDGNSITGTMFETNKKKLHIVYNICQDADVYSIVVASMKGKEKLKDYKIFASDTQSGVWTDDALVYTHNGESSTGTKKFSNKKQMRYVRIEISDKSNTIYLADIQIMGPKYMVLRKKNLNKNITHNNYSFFTQSLKSGETVEIVPEDKEADTKLLHDGNLNVATGICAGIKGKSTSNIMIDLGDLRNVTGIKIYVPRRATAYYPTKTYIYLGSDVNEIQKLDIKPDLVIDGAPKNDCFERDITPKTCRYVRICFAEVPQNEFIEESIVVMNEIAVMGTSVVGMNPDSSNVMDFQDDKLGINWGIVKATKNDVINNIATSKIVVGKATNWQKRSLEKSPHMKVVGGKTYTIKFYDIVGNEITDLEGREVEVSFKIKNSAAKATSMIGYSGNKWYIEALETIQDHYEGYITAYYISEEDSYMFSLLEMIKSTDKYWSTIGELEDYGDEKPEYGPTINVDTSMSYDTIVTVDKDFSISPIGALKLPVDAVFHVDYTTYFLTQDVYDAVLPLADPNCIAATYELRLTQDDVDYPFEGSVNIMLTIPEVLKGYFSGYKLIHIHDDGTSEFVDYTLKSDKIYFRTDSFSKFVLVGEGYSAEGNAALVEGDVNSDSIAGVDSPSTGEKANTLYFLMSVVSLAAIVVLNFKGIVAIFANTVKNSD